MHGKFTPRDRAAARTKFSYAWSVSNASKVRRGETLALANGCSIIDTTSEEARATVARASSEVVSIMLKHLTTKKTILHA